MEKESYGSYLTENGDVQVCVNYRRIKLLSHWKIWKRIIDSSMRAEVEESEEQFGFMLIQIITNAVFIL